MFTELPYDNVHRETSQWMMTSFVDIMISLSSLLRCLTQCSALRLQTLAALIIQSETVNWEASWCLLWNHNGCWPSPMNNDTIHRMMTNPLVDFSLDHRPDRDGFLNRFRITRPWFNWISNLIWFDSLSIWSAIFQLLYQFCLNMKEILRELLLQIVQRTL